MHLPGIIFTCKSVDCSIDILIDGSLDSLQIVGPITDIFTQEWELAACVDTLIPDYFDCSIFAFKPSTDTYEGLVHLLGNTIS